MNEIARLPANPLAEDALVEVLRNSLYPGAKPESVRLVLAWCRATGRDPMKKPIHVVPMWVKDGDNGQGGMRDVLMPGIGTYRSDAASTGQYAGKTEPEFGPDVVATFGNTKLTYPRWCKVTVHRLVAGQVRGFTAMEYWMENYATAGRNTDEPNAMWRKRPYGQLAKCAESQALRMAFPDETGNTNTQEEMDGKTFDGVTLDAEPTPPPATLSSGRVADLQTAQADHRAESRVARRVDSVTPPPPKKQTISEFLDELDLALARAPDVDALTTLLNSPRVANARQHLTNGAADRLAKWTDRAEQRRQAMLEEAAEAAVPAIDAPPADVTAAPSDDLIPWPVVDEPAAAG